MLSRGYYDHHYNIQDPVDHSPLEKKNLAQTSLEMSSNVDYTKTLIHS